MARSPDATVGDDPSDATFKRTSQSEGSKISAISVMSELSRRALGKHARLGAWQKHDRK